MNIFASPKSIRYNSEDMRTFRNQLRNVWFDVPVNEVPVMYMFDDAKGLVGQHAN